MSEFDEKRPSPDQLLSVIQRSEERSRRGQLKIFLGMVAGVGKTYAMLQRAHQLKKDGLDVVVGWVDTHGRKETSQLVEGLEVFPRKLIEHKDVTLEEMDLDGLLKRHPKVVLVDELAHTNAPGSRHAKRFYDVQELLNAGVDVFTTINVQHLESRRDIVKTITGVTVQETVPDSVLDDADEIVLIDLPPEDLLQRLKEGRVYPAERAELASRNFFTAGNLTALRELALRAAAGRVDRELREFKTLHGIDVAWKSSSRLLVAVFASPYSEVLIRWTRQLAETTGGSWIGAYVDTGQSLSDEEKRLLERNTQLVRQLGGDFAAIQDQDLVDGLLRIARQNHVTQIIVGKTQRHTLRNWLSGGSVVSRLLRKSGDIDIHAVATEKVEGSRRKKFIKNRVPLLFPWGESGWVAATLFFVWFFASFVSPLIGYQAVGVIFLMAVMVSGLVFSRVSVLVIAILLSLVHNFFFIPPLYTFSIRTPQDVLMHLMFFLAAASIGHLTTKLKRQNRVIEGREDKAVRLFNLARTISEASSIEEVIRAGVQALQRTFDAEISVISYSVEGKPEILPGSSYHPGAKELAVAEWSRQSGISAGRFTDTLPSSEATYFPLQSRRVVLGVVGIKIPQEAALDYDQRNFAQALAGQLAAGLEREQLHSSRQRLEVLEQADRLYRTLFDSVSHELKTPLTTIKAASSALSDMKEESSKEYWSDLVGQIGSETERLLTVVDNMLDMTRLESGALKPKISEYDTADILGPALKRIETVRGKRNIHTVVDQNIRPILCDAPLLVQALANILHNAILHTKADGNIELYVDNIEHDQVEIRIRDDGHGLPPESPNSVFEKFYRERPELSGGIGLGLSIAKGFVEVTGGTICAKNHPNGGALFLIRLPTAPERVEEWVKLEKRS